MGTLSGLFSLVSSALAGCKRSVRSGTRAQLFPLDSSCCLSPAGVLRWDEGELSDVQKNLFLHISSRGECALLYPAISRGVELSIYSHRYQLVLVTFPSAPLDEMTFRG